MDFVPGHEVFAAVHVLFSGLPPFPMHRSSNRCAALGNELYAGKFDFPRTEGIVRLARPARPATDGDARVGRVVDQVVRHLVFAALPDHDRRRGPVDLSDVMDPIVRHVVALIDILRAGAVAGDQDPDASGMSDLVVDDAVVQAGEIQA